MAQKDIIEKTIFDYPDIFVDIINVFIYNGKQIVQSNEIYDSKTLSQFKSDDSVLHTQDRDVFKEWKVNDETKAFFGIENQTAIDEFMPERINSYDAASYHSQKLAKVNKLAPVVTIVLYFGIDKKWEHSLSMGELMKPLDGVTLNKHYNNQSIKVINVAWLTKKEISKFNSDFKIIANFFVQKRLNPDYIPDDIQEIKYVDEFLNFLSIMSGDPTYKKFINKGVKSMRDINARAKELLVKDEREKARQEGRQEGLQEGLQEGRQEGRQEAQIESFKNAINSGVSFEIALKISNLSEIEGEKILATM